MLFIKKPISFSDKIFQKRDARFSCFPADDDRPYFDGSNGKAGFYLKLYSNKSSDSICVGLQD